MATNTKENIRVRMMFLFSVMAVLVLGSIFMKFNMIDLFYILSLTYYILKYLSIKKHKNYT